MKSFSLTLFLVLGLLLQSKCQLLGFKKIECAFFDVNSYRTNVKDSVFVGLYCTITPKGFVQVYNPGDLQDSPKIYYSIQLSEIELKKVNSVFNSGTSLKKHLVRTELDPNSFYACNYDYFRVEYPNRAIDSICIITAFASESFKEMKDILINVLYRKKERNKIKPFRVPSDFLRSLRISYLQSGYLPEIEDTPSFIPGKRN